MKEVSKNFNWEGIDFPTPLDQFTIFEKNNPDYGINVLAYGGKEVYPARISKKYNCTNSHKIINLLITNEENSHYMWVRSISRLLTPQVSKSHGAKHYCLRCFNHFYLRKSLEKHIEICSNHDAVKVGMPVNEDGSPQHVEFKNIQRQMRHLFTIYADMECFPEKIDTCSPNPNKTYTKQYQKHSIWLHLSDQML